MLRGIYAAASGMDATANAHEAIARNLAHALVPGYRRTIVPFVAYESAEAQAGSSTPAPGTETLGVTNGKLTTDFSPGAIVQTSNPLDVAIQGDGFFNIQGPSGTLYTRSGAFQLDGTGRIVTADGFPVLGAQGLFTLPPNTTASQISIAPDGTVRAGKEELGQLRLTDFPDPQKLESVGASLFRASADIRSTPSEARVVQGSRELSNVSPVNELINLIAAQRHYEASQRSITAMDRAMQRRVEAA